VIVSVLVKGMKDKRSNNDKFTTACQRLRVRELQIEQVPYNYDKLLRGGFLEEIMNLVY